MTARNYIAGRNPFCMSPPPDWWLSGLYNFDHDLVVMPSQTRIGVYWLARRKRFTLGLTDQAIAKEVSAQDTDTAMFLRERVEPVVDITTPLGVWNLEKILKWLHERDTWADEGGPLDADGIAKAWANGGSRFTKKFEEQEAADEARRKAQQRETVWHATGDGWESLQRRQGSRINNAGTVPHQQRQQPASDERRIILTGV